MIDRLIALAGLLGALSFGCADPHVRVELRLPCTTCFDAGLPWGTWAATLDVPLCTDGGVLEVNTLEDRLEDPGLTQPGPSLSFPEALWLARNRPGPDIITFDPQVFPAQAPATLLLTARHRLPSDLAETCIDARNRGVVVDWGESPPRDSFAIWGLGQGSLQVGLVLINLPSMLEAHGSQVAGCRLGTDGTRLATGPDVFSIRSSNATVGPGNVFARGAWMSATILRENDLGFDSHTGAQWSQPVLLRCDPPAMGQRVIVEDNVMPSAALSLFREGVVVMRHNRVGIDRHGQPLPTAGFGLHISGYGVDATATIGPGNLITAAADGVSNNGATVEITQNSIWGNMNGIASTAMVEPPVISSIDGGVVTGTCAVAGRIELFSDFAAQGERFLTATTCTSTWTTTVDPEPGRNLTATLTDLQRQTSPFSLPIAF